MNTSLTRTLCALLAISLSPACQAADSGDIHDRINNAVSRGKVGAAVFGAYDQGDVAVYGYGRTRQDQPQEPDGDTLFEIGSITKVFTAILVQRLAEQGKLDWEQPISSHLTELQFENELVGAITLRSLATHSSGLPRLPTNLSPGDSLDPYADYTRGDLSNFLSSFDPDSLSSEYAYSNLGFGLLGSIAADTAQTDYPAAIAKYILEPLGMSRSFAAYPQQTDPNMASGYSNGAAMPAWTFDALAGAGAIVSSANDLMQFIRAGFEADPSGVPAAIAATQEPQEGHEMALAWHMRSDSDGNTVYWHNGGTGGYASFLAVSPAQSKGWLILAASSDYSWVTELGMSLPAKPQQVEAADLSPYTGVFQLTPDLFLTISEQDGQLFVQATNQPAFPVFAMDPDRFFYKVVDAEIEFLRDDSGAVHALTLHQSGEHRATRIEVDPNDPTARK